MRWFSLLLVCTGLRAQELGELSTERPGFTATSGMVGFGVLQLEQGYTFESARDAGSKTTTWSGPQAVVRFGIADALELRFSTDGYAWQTEQMAAERSALSGPNDYIVGAKFRLLKQRVLRPEVSITGGVSLPARGSPFTSCGHDPTFTLAAYKDLPDKFSLAANANAASVTDSQGQFASSGQSIWVARTLAGGVSMFAETFHTTIGRLEGSETVVDAGFFRGIGRHMQLDVSAGHTVAGVRPSWYLTMGCVVRAPRTLLAPGWFRFGR